MQLDGKVAIVTGAAVRVDDGLLNRIATVR